MSADKDYSENQLLEAIKGTAGIVSVIAKKLQCDWHTADRHINKFESTIQAYRNEKEAVLDLAENVIIKAIREEDVQTAKWMLTVKGKDRGYQQSMELSGKIETVLPEKDIQMIAQTLKEFFTDDKIE